MRIPLPVAVALAGLAFYAATVAPTVLWGDDAELQRIVVTGEGRAIGQSSRASHLLWLAAASTFVRLSTPLPLDAAGRANAVSALSAALALPLVYAATVELAASAVSRPRLAGLTAAASLGLSHTFWLLAARPDVYTLEAALLAVATWGVLRWRRGNPLFLAVAALAVTAALTNHVMILASGFGLGALALAVPAPARRRLWIAAVVSAAAALAAGVVAVRRDFPLDDLARAVLSYRPQWPGLRDALLVPLYLVYQFPLSLPLAAWGVRRLSRRDRGALAGLALLYTGNVLLMLLRHHPAMYVRDQFIFYLPSYLPVALLIGVGVAVVLERPRTCAAEWRAALGRVVPPALPVPPRPARYLLPTACCLLVLAPVAIYPLAARLGGAVAARLAPARTLPGRDPVGYYLLPSKSGYAGARQYAEAAMVALEPQAAVVADWLPYQTLRYLQVVEGRRPDVLLEQINAGDGRQLQFLLAHRGERPLYLADASPPPYYELADIERCFAVTRQDVVYRLTARLDATEACG